MRKAKQNDKDDFYTIRLQIVDAVMSSSLTQGFTEPEAKRKTIGERFIRVFEREQKKQVHMPASGPLPGDRIEIRGYQRSPTCRGQPAYGITKLLTS